MKFSVQNITRKNILSLKPYSSARDEFAGEASVFLDANENPFNAPYNRYPDPRQLALKARIGQLKNIESDAPKCLVLCTWHIKIIQVISK